MSKMPPHIVSLIFYCHRCKTPNTLLSPDKNIEWQVTQVVEGDEANGALMAIIKCPKCQKDIEITVKKWKQEKTE